MTCVGEVWAWMTYGSFCVTVLCLLLLRHHFVRHYHYKRMAAEHRDVYESMRDSLIRQGAFRPDHYDA